MERQLITKINGIEIFAETSDYGETLIPIKPICKAIGVDYAGQFRKIQEDEILSSTIDLRSTVGTDGKTYEMASLPLKFVYGWIFTINPKNVDPEAKDNVIKYRRKCYEALYNHFFVNMVEINRITTAENKERRELENLLETRRDIDNKIKEKKSVIGKLDEQRRNIQPNLFTMA